MWEKFAGPSMLVYLVAATVTGIWWASNLSQRVADQEKASQGIEQTGERIARLEALVGHVDDQLNRIEAKIDVDRNRNR